MITQLSSVSRVTIISLVHMYTGIPFGNGNIISYTAKYHVIYSMYQMHVYSLCNINI